MSKSSEVFHLEENEFVEQVQTAQQIVTDTFHTTSPLNQLGYSYPLIQRFDRVIDSVRQGHAESVNINDLEYSFYVHSASFSNEEGFAGITFSGNGDFNVRFSFRQLDVMPPYHDVELFLLKQNISTEQISLAEVGRKIVRGNIVSNLLERIPVVGKYLRRDRSNYYSCYYLDERTKTDIVIKAFDGDNFVLRKVNTTSGYEVWGLRHNLSQEDIEKATSQNRRAKTVYLQQGN